MTLAPVPHRFRRIGAFALLCALTITQAGFSGSPQVSPPSAEPQTVGQVTDLAASADGQAAGSVRLIWTTAENAQVHFVAYLKSSDLFVRNFGDMRMAPFSGSQAVITDLDGGTPYHFIVIGMRWNFVDFGTVWGGWSQWVSATPSGSPPSGPAPTLPTAEPQSVGPITNLTAAVDGQDTGAVRLTWTEAENAQVHFIVYLPYADAAVSDFSAVRMVPFNGSEAVITGLDGGTPYHFIAIGMRWNFVQFATVWGAWSQWVSATPRDAAPEPVQVPGSILIPDANLRAALERELGKPSGAPIFPVEMATLHQVVQRNSRIRDLEGIQHATNLRALVLDSNDISDLTPLAGLTDLQTLHLAHNDVEDLSPLAGLSRLRTLHLSRNNVSELSPLAETRALGTLLLSHNNISDLSPLSRLPSLRTLQLANNSITDLGPLVDNTRIGRYDRIVAINNPLNAASINTHAPTLRSRGVEIHTEVLFTVDDGPQIFNNNLVVLPVSENLVTDQYSSTAFLAPFYQHFEDEFDFLLLVSNLDYQEDQVRSYSGQNQRIRNDVEGIGIRTYSLNQRFNVGEKLQSRTHLTRYDSIRHGPALHELLHQWANYAIPTSSRGHWGFSSADGQLGGFNLSDLKDLGNGRYTAGYFGLVANGGNGLPYSPIELYLAGFIPPAEVPDLWVAEDGEWLLDDDGNRVITASRHPIFTASNIKTYTIEDIIAEHGPRVPDHTQAQHDFRAAAILLIDEDHPATRQGLNIVSEHVSWFSHPGGDSHRLYNFHEATGGRGTITMDGLSDFQKPQTP